jgi:hypothetical protein
VRAQSGATFLLEGSSCKFAERLAHVSRFLNWLSPLEALTKDDQRVLGLLAANGRPVQTSDEDDDADADADIEANVEAVASAPEQPAAGLGVSAQPFLA